MCGWSTRLFHVALSIAVITLTSAGCASNTKKRDIGWPEPRPDLTGYNNIYADGEMLFAGQPNEAALARAADDGVTLVINLRTETEMSARVPFDEPALAEKLGMRYVSIPVTPKTLNPETALVLDETLSVTRGKILLHCGSSNRVGALWAMYLNRQRGYDIEDALARGKKAGLKSPKLVDVVRKHAVDQASNSNSDE